MTLPADPFDAWHRAANARDASFDGVFFVAVTTTHIYCRPSCPSRTARPERRRFFLSIAAAERAGFRACRRCRPELAPGGAPMDAVARLARIAADHIAAGALNGRSLEAFATELGVSARHLRRALRRELGVSAHELVDRQRLSRAKHMLANTTVPVIQVAYASGFQSLRRFNASFRDRYSMAPSDLRRPRRDPGTPSH